MELIQCYVENFGTLSGVTLRLTSGLNAFCLKNGQGKTTLCDFIKCMLYGLPDSRRHSLTDNERKHYTPWQGGIFGGSLILRHEGRTYRLARTFGTKPAEDRLEIFDEQTGEITNALGGCPGETLLGMDRDGFAACALFSERSFAPTLENESILTCLGGEKETGGSLAAALSRLENERRLYEKKNGNGLLAQTEAEISRLTELRISNLKAAESLKQKESDLIAAKAELAKATRQQRTSTAHNDVSCDFPQKRKTVNTPLLSFSLILLLFSLAFGNFLNPLLFLFAIPAAILFFLSFSKKITGAESERQADDFEFQADVRESYASRLFEDRYRACAKCERAYVECLEAAEEAAYLTTQIEGLEKKKNRLAWELSDIKKTESLLTEAGRRYRENRAEAAKERFADSLSALGEVQSQSFKLGDRFSPFFLKGESFRSAEALSHGEKDRVTLARSLALLSAMPEEKRPPLLLDDPFLSYDDEHLELALTALTRLAKKYQIVYLTCSHSRMP